MVRAGIVAEDPANMADAMARIADAVTHCKFEASDAVSDEVVLMNILQVHTRARAAGTGAGRRRAPNSGVLLPPIVFFLSVPRHAALSRYSRHVCWARAAGA